MPTNTRKSIELEGEDHPKPFADDAAKIEATALATSKQKSLELLFDYTKFHIGLYLTLTASYIAAAAIKSNEKFVLEIDPHLVFPAVIFFMLAGLAGGIIASSITQTTARSAAEFLEREIGPWDWNLMKARYWTWMEHTSFWIGLVIAALSATPK